MLITVGCPSGGGLQEKTVVVNSMQSDILRGRRNIHLGRFRFEKLAALAYDFAALKYFREFACFNF